MVDNQAKQLQSNLRRLSRIHVLYLMAFGISLLAYQAWKLLSPDSIQSHWIAFSAISLILAFIWLKARFYGQKANYYRRLAWLLISSDIALAAFVVYAQRGVASRGVALFSMPIVVATVFRSKGALIFASLASAATYTLVSLAYAAVYPREGYKIELYGTLAFYSATFLLLASLLWVFIRPNSTK